MGDGPALVVVFPLLSQPSIQMMPKRAEALPNRSREEPFVKNFGETEHSGAQPMPRPNQNPTKFTLNDRRTKTHRQKEADCPRCDLRPRPAPEAWNPFHSPGRDVFPRKVVEVQAFTRPNPKPDRKEPTLSCAVSEPDRRNQSERAKDADQLNEKVKPWA